MGKPILCLDFDGVIHSYTSGWKGAAIISDPPVPGALEFISNILQDFEVHIFSSRSHQDGGIAAMQEWLIFCIEEEEKETNYPLGIIHKVVYDVIKWPTVKPPAMITIDDRAICFTGLWPNRETLLNFKPWNKK